MLWYSEGCFSKKKLALAVHYLAGIKENYQEVLAVKLNMVNDRVYGELLMGLTTYVNWRYFITKVLNVC